MQDDLRKGDELWEVWSQTVNHFFPSINVVVDFSSLSTIKDLLSACLSYYSPIHNIFHDMLHPREFLFLFEGQITHKYLRHFQGDF